MSVLAGSLVGVMFVIPYPGSTSLPIIPVGLICPSSGNETWHALHRVYSLRHKPAWKTVRNVDCIFFFPVTRRDIWILAIVVLCRGYVAQSHGPVPRSSTRRSSRHNSRRLLAAPGARNTVRYRSHPSSWSMLPTRSRHVPHEKRRYRPHRVQRVLVPFDEIPKDLLDTS